MEDKKEILNNFEEDVQRRKIWFQTPDPSFLDLSTLSRVPYNWLSYNRVASGPYAKAPVKPVNNYVQNIALKPSLAGISGNEVTLTFRLYADMYLLKNNETIEQEDLKEDFYHVDRPWMRQYYLTNEKMDKRDDCFDGTFKFFVPWFIDQDGEVTYSNADDSPFFIQEKRDYWFNPKPDHEFVNPHMVTFQFKKTGKHMHDEELGIPRRGDATFNMTMSVSDIILESIKEYYANN